MDLETLGSAEDIFYLTFGEFPKDLSLIKGSGSDRSYVRGRIGENTYIACVSDNVKENDTFINLDKYLEGKGLKVPHIFGVTYGREEYLMEDLGDDDLLKFISNSEMAAEGEDSVKRLIEQSIAELVKFQSLPENEWETLVEFRPFDSELIDYDLEYAVKYLFKPSGISFNNSLLSKDYQKLKEVLSGYPNDLQGLMYRDFQSRNIMIKEGQPYLIDFQSARKGPGIYDLVSFAWQAKARFSEEEREWITDIYIKEWSRLGKDIEKRVKSDVHYWALFRIIQTLGAYGRRGLVEGKKHFIESLPIALGNCNRILLGPLKNEFPELARIIKSLIFCNFA